MGALLALLVPLIPGLIQGVQQLFAHAKPVAPNPATPAPDLGQAKNDAVLQSLRAMVGKLAAINAPLPDGTLPATVPVTDDSLRAAIETVYQQLKAGGNLQPQPAAGALWLVQGTVTALKLGPQS